MRLTHVMMTMVIGCSMAHPTPQKCNKPHLTDTPIFGGRAEEPAFYVLNHGVPYPFNHPGVMAPPQIQSRAPQSQSQTPTTTSFLGISGFPPVSSITSFTSLFPVSGAKCVTNSGDDGVCKTQSDCDNEGGVKDGDCGTYLFRSAGVCCSYLIKKCSDTGIRSPLVWTPPTRVSSKVSCTLTFPANPGLTLGGTTIGGGLTASTNAIRTCQLKVEFQNFRLAGPNPTTTVCEDDYFTVSGNAFKVPKLCGDAYIDQTIYLAFNADQEDITMGFFLQEAANKDWRLKITRIPCSSADLAPTNCLQYLSKTAGQIESFNFRQENPSVVRQLADMEYNICFKQQTGYCSTCFTPCQTYKNVSGFLLTKSGPNGTSDTSGSRCTDQLIIPAGSNGQSSVRESVYCGAALNTEPDMKSDDQICTSSDRITYITDAMEEADENNNVGFCLAYTQKKC